MDSNLTNASCDMWPDNPSRCTYLLVARQVSASLSALGVIFIMLVIWAFDKYQFFAQRLIFWLSLTSLCGAVGYLLGGVSIRKDPLCLSQAIVTQFCQWAQLLWICCMAVNIVHIMWRGCSATGHYRCYHGIVWTTATIATVIPYEYDSYGPSGPWCWITIQHIWMRFFIWYIPMWIVIILLVFVYIAVWITVRHHVRRWSGTYTPNEEYKKKLLSEDLQQLKYYPLMYLLLAIVPTTDRICEAVSDDDNRKFWLMLPHAAIEPLTGFCYAIALLLDRDTREQLTCSRIYYAICSHFTGHDIQEYRPIRSSHAHSSYGTSGSWHPPPQR